MVVEVEVITVLSMASKWIIPTVLLWLSSLSAAGADPADAPKPEASDSSSLREVEG